MRQESHCKFILYIAISRIDVQYQFFSTIAFFVGLNLHLPGFVTESTSGDRLCEMQGIYRPQIILYLLHFQSFMLAEYWK